MKFLLVLALNLISVAVFADEPLEKRIVGTWAQQQGFDRVALRFYADHNGLIVTSITPIKFTWQTNGTKIELIITKEDGGKHICEVIAGKNPDEVQWKYVPAEDKQYETLKLVPEPKKPDGK